MHLSISRGVLVCSSNCWTKGVEIHPRVRAGNAV